VSEYPADWAIEKAIEPANKVMQTSWTVAEIKGGGSFMGYTTISLELARMIEKHEQPPIDPDEQLARDIALKHGFEHNGRACHAILEAIKQVRANAL